MVAGTVALLAGIGAAFAVDLPIFPIALIVIGVCLFLGSARKNFRRSSDHEHGACCWLDQIELTFQGGRIVRVSF